MTKLKTVPTPRYKFKGDGKKMIGIIPASNITIPTTSQSSAKVAKRIKKKLAKRAIAAKIAGLNNAPKLKEKNESREPKNGGSW